MQYETLVWLAPTLVGVAVFSAILAFFWPRETAKNPLSPIVVRTGEELEQVLGPGEEVNVYDGRVQ